MRPGGPARLAPCGGGRIEDAARHRRPPSFLGVGCTEDGTVDTRRLGFWRVFGQPTRPWRQDGAQTEPDGAQTEPGRISEKKTDFPNHRFSEKRQLPVRLKSIQGADCGKKVRF